MISAKRLADGSAMSTKNQPHLAGLISDIRSGKHRLLVLAGAGVSMDAGLPSWHELIKRLEETLKEPTASQFKMLGATEIERRTQQILYLATKEAPRPGSAQRVLDALFGHQDPPPPGQMAEAIARLVDVYRSDVEVLTTNFDPILEGAFDKNGMASDSFSLDGWGDSGLRRCDIEAWKAQNPDDRSTSVFHLHGMLRDGHPNLDPLVLTESEFSRHGHRVQQLLEERLPGALTVIVGMSMTDPNLLIPLRKSKDSAAGNRYIITVPTLSGSFGEALGGTEEEQRASCADFAHQNAEMISADLGVKPILLKSYGQVIQLLSDLSLAHVETVRYRTGYSPASQSLHYGTRFSSALASTYRRIGFGPKTGRPRDAAAAEALSRHVRERAIEAGGPLRRLERWRDKYAGQVDPMEKVGFFVWLRDPRGSRESGSYSIRLLASSTYFHWEEWSNRNVQEVKATSQYAPALAVFNGQEVRKNIESGVRGIWRGALAVPLVQPGSSSDASVMAGALDRLTIGAIAMNSSSLIEISSQHKATDHSVMTRLNAEEKEELQLSLFRLVELAFDDAERSRTT